ncbi:MAG: hypothetical protein RLZZ127_63 [Planctomycetota bacterium]|jgi:hypothetical protein
MIALRCAHCGAPLIEGEACPDHPFGVAVAYEADEPEGG